MLLMVMSSNAFHVYRVALPSSQREEEDRVQALKKKCLLPRCLCVEINTNGVSNGENPTDNAI